MLLKSKSRKAMRTTWTILVNEDTKCHYERCKAEINSIYEGGSNDIRVGSWYTRFAHLEKSVKFFLNLGKPSAS